jgi:hypothetical protein
MTRDRLVAEHTEMLALLSEALDPDKVAIEWLGDRAERTWEQRVRAFLIRRAQEQEAS